MFTDRSKVGVGRHLLMCSSHNNCYLLQMLRLKIGLLLLTVFLLHAPQFAQCTCTPSDVRSNLTQCLQFHGLYTYYQFPIIPAANYTALCSNTTCLADCLVTTVKACQSHAFMSHLTDGSPLKAAYLGLCAENQTDVEAALTCTENIANQDALNQISVFETEWQGYYENNTANNDTLCSDWVALKTNLDSLVMTASCAGSSLIEKTIWYSFLNTLVAPCSTLTPSYYANYSFTPVTSCNRVPDNRSSIVTQLLFFIAGFLLSKS